jgi:hypothetical protein
MGTHEQEGRAPPTPTPDDKINIYFPFQMKWMRCQYLILNLLIYQWIQLILWVKCIYNHRTRPNMLMSRIYSFVHICFSFRVDMVCDFGPPSVSRQKVLLPVIDMARIWGCCNGLPTSDGMLWFNLCNLLRMNSVCECCPDSYIIPM